MAELTSLQDALVDEIKDLYDAEQQLVKALPEPTPEPPPTNPIPDPLPEFSPPAGEQ